MQFPAYICMKLTQVHKNHKKKLTQPAHDQRRKEMYLKCRGVSM